MIENQEEYLRSTDIVDWKSPAILSKARELADGCRDEVEKAKLTFQWVRDGIRHSYDFSLNPLTCSASDVLKHRTGFCYAKSHLLVALLRANGIPSGFCYQRLRGENPGDPFSLHGYCAAYLRDFGWYRMDPRGNKAGIDAQFIPPVEKLAFPISAEGEWDDPRVRPEPLTIVVEALNQYQTWDGLLKNLPDLVKPI